MAGTDKGVVIVTGAAGGIGYAIAQTLAETWPRIALLDLNADAVEARAAELRAGGADARAYSIDLSDADAIAPTMDRVRGDFGPIEGLVNNAGILQLKTLASTTASDFDLTIAINLRAPFLLIQSVAPDMIGAGRGAIVSIASSAGKTGGSSAQGVYGASKAAVTCLTKSFARELAPHGVRVNSVSPALIETPMLAGLSHLASAVPLGRLGKPAEVASVVAFLMSESASFVTGEDVDINGGFLMD